MPALQTHKWLIVSIALTSGAVGGCSSLTNPQGSTTQRADREAINGASQGLPRRAVPGLGAAEPAGTRAVDAALLMVGTPYRYGGSTPAGFDCSGLVHYAYEAAGIATPRTTTQLLRASNRITLSEAREGDLLFFEITSKPDHVGIFIGNGRFVHAPSTGQRVSIATLDDPFWRNTFVGAHRLHR